LRPAGGFPGLADDNRAAHLNGTSSYVSVPDRAELDITGAVTMEAWIKLDEYPVGNGGIISKYVGSGSQRGYQIYVNLQNGGIGALGMVISPDGTFNNARDVVDDVALPLGEWLHVAGTYQHSQFMRLYVNGQLVHEVTTNIPANIFSNTSDLWLGRQFSSSADFHLPGLIDEAAVYARALTSTEVLEHFLAATLLAGDYNDNGVVDAADYVVWRNAPASATLPNDTTPGIISAADYAVWRSNFGNSLFMGSASTVNSAVPEPNSLLLAILAVLIYIGLVVQTRP
jgi:hypothetical protein